MALGFRYGFNRRVLYFGFRITLAKIVCTFLQPFQTGLYQAGSAPILTAPAYGYSAYRAPVAYVAAPPVVPISPAVPAVPNPTPNPEDIPQVMMYFLVI